MMTQLCEYLKQSAQGRHFLDWALSQWKMVFSSRGAKPLKFALFRTDWNGIIGILIGHEWTKRYAAMCLSMFVKPRQALSRICPRTTECAYQSE